MSEIVMRPIAHGVNRRIQKRAIAARSSMRADSATAQFIAPYISQLHATHRRCRMPVTDV